MKLAAAIELGNACGLLTAEECVDFANMQATSLFLYADIATEMAELQEEWEASLEYPEIPRMLQECAKCEGITWHRANVCLRCTRK